MKYTDVVVIGGGQAGLSASWCLARRGIDHVVLERGRIAERWRSGSWDSLRLLTPNWQSRLPGYHYDGSDVDGYMRASELVGYLQRYASTFGAHVEERTAVSSVRLSGDRYVVSTDAGDYVSRCVIIATGHCAEPHVPGFARQLDRRLHQIVPARYENPGQLDSGGVLVVGASATGAQLAAEIQASGRPVALCVGRHTRVPRTYRGRDILWWLECMGTLRRRAGDVADLDAARNEPSLQLVGTPERRDLDLAVLRDAGVRMTGSVAGVDGEKLRFASDLVEHARDADQRLDRLLDRVDRWVRAVPDIASGDARRPVPFVPDPGVERLSLWNEGFRTVVWATGYRRDYRWLAVPVLDARGEVRHEGGITPAPGLYVLGLPFLRRRNSQFIDGVGQDAHQIVQHLAGYLRATSARMEAA